MQCLTFLEVDVGEERLSSVQQSLMERVVGYGGAVGRHALDLEGGLVIAAWPDVAVIGILQVEDYIDVELLGDLQAPARCFRPRQEWPSEPPVSRVHASDTELFNVAAAGLARGLFEPVLEQAIFCDDHGRKILSGSDSDKDLGGGRIERRERFISILVPLNSYLPRLGGDSPLLPNVTRMSLVTLEQGEVLELDSEDMTSCL